MRLISQSGKFDIPYDEIVVELFGECVVGRLKEYIGRDIILGSYSTEEKAQKAMEMLREYKETKEIRSIPLTKSLMESFSNVKMENFEIYTDGTGDYLKVDIVKKVEYFQFPQDEDVEV